MIPFSWPVGEDDQRSKPWPIGDWFIGQGFAQKYPASMGRNDWHPSIDLNRPGYMDSGAPVRAAADGVIRFVGAVSGWQKDVVVIEHVLEDGRSIWSRYAHIDAIPLVKDSPVKRGDLLGHIADYTPIGSRAGDHLDFSMAWRDLGKKPGDWPGTDIARLRIDYVDPVKFIGGRIATRSVVPWGKCYVGLGMGNPQPLTPLELGVIRKSNVEAFKMLTLSDPDQNKALIAQLRQIRPDMFIAARLFFSAGFANQTRFSPTDFVNTVSNGFEACYEVGVRYFELHNEPNLYIEGNDWNWRGGAEFGSWLSQVIALLRQRHGDLQLGYPGLSLQLNAPGFLAGSKMAIAQCDWIGVHNYWQSPNGQQPYPMDGFDAGAGFYTYRDRFPNKMLMLTEFSNNSPDVSDRVKGTQYAQYYQVLRREPNLGAAFVFALSWPGQDANHEGWIRDRRETGIVGAMCDTATPARAG